MSNYNEDWYRLIWNAWWATKQCLRLAVCTIYTMLQIMKCSCRASKLSVISSPSFLPVSCLLSSRLLSLSSHTLHKRPQFKLTLIRSDMYTKYQALSIFLPCIVFPHGQTQLRQAASFIAGTEKKNHLTEEVEDIKMEGEEERRNNWCKLQTQLKGVVRLGRWRWLSERSGVRYLKGPVNWNRKFICNIQVNKSTGNITFVLWCEIQRAGSLALVISSD